MKLSDLLSKLDYTLVQGSIDTDVTAVENDSRKVSEGSLFFCITGAVFDGHKELTLFAFFEQFEL